LKILRKDKDVVDLITTVGQQSTGFGGAQATTYQSEVQVNLTDKSERSESTDIKSAKVKRALEEKFTGVEFKTAPIGIMGAENAPIEMVVTAPDNATAVKEATRILNLLKKVPGAVDAELSTDTGNPEVQVNLDRDKMASLGLNLSSVGQQCKQHSTVIQTENLKLENMNMTLIFVLLIITENLLMMLKFNVY
jgi:HAE1 family hydrophobic/amphiphilic exporter-1